MPALSEAENKFFSSRGSEVDPTLNVPEPAPELEGGDAPPEAPPAAAVPAPAPAPAPAPEPKPPEPKPQGEPSAQVPIAALHEERRRRAEAEQSARALQQQIEEFRRAMEQAQAPQPPDPNEDPVGALRYQNEQLARQLEEVRQWRAQQDQAAQQQGAYMTLTQRVAAAEQAFRQSAPDYDQATQFMLQAEDRRLQAFYPDAAQRAQVLRQEAANMLSQALQQGRDPAQVLYEAARNMGYTAPAPDPQPQATPALSAAPAPAEAASAAVKTIQKGLQQQSTLSAGGSTPPSEMTAEMLAGIRDPVEFNKQWAKVFGRR